MALVPLRTLLDHAAENNYGVAAFNVNNMEQIQAIMEAAGIDRGVVQGGGTRKLATRSFHSLRHSFSSALMNAGVPEELRMRLTGHRSKAVHQGYSHAEVETLRAAVSKLPSLGGGQA